MNKKTFIINLSLTCLLLIVAYALLQTQATDLNTKQIGDYVFENTNKEGTDVKKIIIKKPNLQISLFYENKFWHVSEADGYYADLVTINKLFQDINTAKIEAMATNVSTKEAEIKESDIILGTEIQTYNAKGKLLDSIIIGKKKNNFFYAAKKGEEQIYLISGAFDFPNCLHYWLQQPLISIYPENIESIILQSNTGQQLAYRLSKQSPFYNIKQQEVNITPLLEKFALLMFNNVKQIKNTPLNSLTPDKIVVLFPYSGLIYGVEIFKIEEDYWLKVDLSITRLPTKLASDYIKDSLFLYEGWAFKIERNLGKYLTNYKIN